MSDVWESAGLVTEVWESNTTPGVLWTVVIRDGDIVATVSDEQLATAVNALIVAGEGIEAVFDPGSGEDPPSLTLSAVLTGGGGSNLRVDLAIGDEHSDIDLDAAAPGDMPAVLVLDRASGNGVYEASVVDGWTLLDPQPTLVVADALVLWPDLGDPVLDTGVASIYDYSDTAGWQSVGLVPTLDGNPSQVWGPTGWVTPDGGVALSDTAPQDLGTAAAGTSEDASRADHVHDMPTAADIAVDASGFDGNLTTSDDTVQEIAQKLDDLVIPAAGIADPGGSNDDFLQRKSGAWTYRTPAQVQADLGVAEPSYYVDNEFYLLSQMNDRLGSTTAVTPGTNAMAFWLLIVERTIQVDGLWFYLQATGTGAKMRFGIWAPSATTGKPTGSPLVTSAEVDVSASTGYKSQTFTPVTLTPGTYWGGVAALGAATYRTWAAASSVPPVDMGGPDSSTAVHWSFNSPWIYSSSALPDVSGFTFTPQSGTIPPATGAPYVRWRVQIP